MNILAAILIFLGLFFFLGGSIGIIRFPDFYSRLHPAGMLDTMGLLLTMLGMAIFVLADQNYSVASIIVALKILLIVIFVYITSPTATHAIVDAGVRAGLDPWTKKNKEEE